MKDDVLRERAKQDDVVRKLEKSKMEADHSEKKEILAREELEKERVCLPYCQLLQMNVEIRISKCIMIFTGISNKSYSKC